MKFGPTQLGTPGALPNATMSTGARVVAAAPPSSAATPLCHSMCLKYPRLRAWQMSLVRSIQGTRARNG